MDFDLNRHLRAAYRGDLLARRLVLQRLRQLGHSCLAGVLASAFAPDVCHLDGWVLAQIASVVPLTDEALDDIMPWRSPDVAGRAIARALKERTGRSWHVRLVRGYGLSVGPPQERLLAGNEMSEEDRDILAKCFGFSSVKYPGVSFPNTAAGLRECVARAEGRAYVYSPEEVGP